MVGSSHQFVGAERGAGDVLVTKAGERHSFRNTGSEARVTVDVHFSPRFIQDNLDDDTP